MDRKKLAVVHIVKKELGLSDEEYRNILVQACGVKSAKELDEEKFRRLMNYFARSKYYRIWPGGLTIKQKLFIKFLAGRLGWGKVHLENFSNKYYGKRKLDFLSKKEAAKLIESLKNINERRN